MANGEIIPRPVHSRPLAVAGWPAVPFYSALIAVPPDAEVRMEAISIRSEETGEHRIAPFPRILEDGSAVFEWADRLPAGFFPAPWHEASRPAFLRDQRIVAVTLYPVRYDRSRGVTQLMREGDFRIRFVREKKSPAPKERGRLDPLERLLQGTLLNARSPWARWEAPREAPTKEVQQEDSFASSIDWIRIEIAESGLYFIDYEDLVDLGIVDPRTEIGDPRTIRLYTGGGLPLPAPLSEERPGWMGQVAIRVAGEEDGSFDPEDRIEFYARSCKGWLGEFMPDSSLYYDHQDHPYADRNVYWLTWAGSFSEPVAERVETVPAAPRHAPGDGSTNLTAFPERLHFEEDRIQDLTRYGEDGWFWEKFAPHHDEATFMVETPDADESASGSVKIRFFHYAHEEANDYCGTERIWATVNGDAFDIWQYNSCETVDHSYTPRDFEESGFPVINGANEVNIRVGFRKKVYLAWIEMGYPRFFRALGGELHFRIDEPGAYRVPIAGFEGVGARLFHVSDPRNVSEIGGLGASADSVVAYLSLDEPATFHIAAPEAWKKPSRMERTSPAELRSPSTGAEYLVIAFDPFLPAAQKLAAHREDAYSSMVVSLSDVFDQFSWGLPDAFAVRDFLAHAFHQWPEGERPAYVLLLGDATSDFRNRSDPGISCDLPAPYVFDPYGSETQTYASDELLTYLDPSEAGEEDWAPDIAIGRLPANSLDEANGMVEKIIEYDRSPERGGWRNNLLFFADDYLRGSRGWDCGFLLSHTNDCEEMAERFPGAFHRERIYTVEYPLEGDEKPEAHDALIDRLREGCLIANYVGHGGVDKLADEEILVLRDAAQKALRNEERQPLFLAWSCSVGSFDLLEKDCLAEALLKTRGAGMIGTVAGTAPTFASVSRSLGTTLFSRLFPAAHSRVPVGAALMMAKAVAGGSLSAQKINDQKYHLLGDPALVLGAPPPRHLAGRPLTPPDDPGRQGDAHRHRA